MHNSFSPLVDFDVHEIRQDFPILSQQINGYPLAYLDNAATTQKPQSVIDKLVEYYTTMNANIHRGVHHLSMRATAAFENTREKIQRHINAESSKEIIFVRGSTEAINLVANTYGLQHCRTGDEILITEMEHHSNIVPWQLLCERTGATLKIIPFNQIGEIDLNDVERLITTKTRLVAVTHISNALGTINPVEEIVQLAHRQGVPVLIDGAQAGPHLAMDVQAIDCDFYTLSAHKMYGPTGIGALYAKQTILNDLPPYQGGGEMIHSVTFEQSDYAPPPQRFEAGTLPIASVVAWANALDYLQKIGFHRIQAYENALLAYATEKAERFESLIRYGSAGKKASILTFNLSNIHAHDVGTICDQYGVAIRTGHHCAMPVMQHFDVSAMARASLAFYNTFEEIDRLFLALEEAKEIFQV